MAVAVKAKRKPRKPPTPEQLLRREQATFARRIQGTFRNAGFVYVPTKDIERKFGLKTGELDQVFVYENIILVCEDTVAKDPREHLKNKKILFEEISKNEPELVNWLRTDFPERFEGFEDYDVSRYRVFYLYFTKHKLNLSAEDVALFQPVRVVENSALGYFQKMAQNIKLSARTDIFRFLDLASTDVGTADSSKSKRQIETAIIYPSDNTGLKNGVRIVSFMMAADTLLKNSFVLRKDNWQDSIQLYQRLIEKDRIQSIRKHLATKKTTFFNNIIVSLPRDISFKDSSEQAVDLDSAQSYQTHKLLIPDEFNSICVIDGQHRIYAHYEGSDSFEPIIKKLRGKFHLLVTGLIFPDTMSRLEQRKYESEIFLDINSNARPVPPDVLLFIETLKDPYSDLGIARQVLEELNTKTVFRNLFQLSLMEESRIKIASIIKFALRYLVDINDEAHHPSLFQHWDVDATVKKSLLDQNSEDNLNAYIKYLAQVLDQYFSALRSTNRTDWDDPDSKILSTTSINGFIMAMRRSLHEYGVQDFDFYRKSFGMLQIDFSRGAFIYTSSQYNKFSKMILDQAFDLVESGDLWVKAHPTSK